jgi:hypothetical protein
MKMQKRNLRGDKQMTHDLTKITTPFGLLDAETQDALRQAYSDNIGVQVYTRHGWTDMVLSPEWYGSCTYRIKPDPKLVSQWVNIYAQSVGNQENSRREVDVAAVNGRICVLRIDWCDGDVTFHKEEI